MNTVNCRCSAQFEVAPNKGRMAESSVYSCLDSHYHCSFPFLCPGAWWSSLLVRGSKLSPTSSNCSQFFFLLLTIKQPTISHNLFFWPTFFPSNCSQPNNQPLLTTFFSALFSLPLFRTNQPLVTTFFSALIFPPIAHNQPANQPTNHWSQPTPRLLRHHSAQPMQHLLKLKIQKIS